jgi:hypothetical protein
MHFDKQIYKWLEIETRKRDDEECLARWTSCCGVEISLIEQKILFTKLWLELYIVYLYCIIFYCAQTWTLKSQNTSKLLSDTVRAYMDAGKNTFEVTEEIQ